MTVRQVFKRPAPSRAQELDQIAVDFLGALQRGDDRDDGKAMIAAIAIFEEMPMPNQTMISGASAIFGSPLSAMR